MCKKASPENFERLPDAVAQLLANATAFFDALLVVSFEKALVGVANAARQTARVNQPVEQDELAVEAACHHRFEVELDIARPREARGVAEEPQPPSVSDDPPERIAAVQIILNHRMRAQLGLAALVELLVRRDDVNWRLVLVAAKAVGDRIGTPARLKRGALETKIVTEFLQERQHPCFARDRGRAFLASVEARLEGIPISGGVGERALNFLAQPAFDAEVARPLTLH